MKIEPAKRLRNVGEYYFSRKLAEVRRLDSPELPVINLGIGSPDLAPSDEVIETLVDAARRPTSHAYQGYRGVPELRQAIADYLHGTFGAAVDPATEILPLMGSKEGILHTTMAFVDEGADVLIPDPGYPTYAAAAKLAGGQPRTYQLREDLDWGIDFDHLEQVDLSPVKLMWINFPHMPTGRVASRAELERLLDIAQRNHFLLVNDNPYAMILNDTPVSILGINGARDVALELGSLSKSHNMAGWRVGWIAGRADYVDLVLQVRSNMDSGMFLPVQLAAAKALESRDEWFRELNETYASRRHEIQEILRVLGCSFNGSQAGLFVWARVPDSVVDVETWLDEILHSTKVFIAPGFIFGEAGRRHVRLSLCNPVETIREARKRIEACVSGHSDRAPRAEESSEISPLPRFAQSVEMTAATPPDSQSAIRNSQSTVAIVGLGLIGGSIAIDLRRNGFAKRLIGVDSNEVNATTALQRGLVDEVCDLDDALALADVVVLAVPVDSISALAPRVLDGISDEAVVVDTGSTKQSVCEAIASHPRRGRFVAAHPIAGTENSGPDAALSGLFRAKINIVCERERSDANALESANTLLSTLGMSSVFMGARDHDRHLAYVSHLSHVTSFILGQTVLDIENDEENIFLLAGSGLESTVRLAKSSPSMWAPIFDQNGPFLIKALDEYIVHLQRFRSALSNRDVDSLHTIMTEANDIRRVLAHMDKTTNGAPSPPPAVLSDSNQNRAPHSTTGES